MNKIKVFLILGFCFFTPKMCVSGFGDFKEVKGDMSNDKTIFINQRTVRIHGRKRKMLFWYDILPCVFEGPEPKFQSADFMFWPKGIDEHSVVDLFQWSPDDRLLAFVGILDGLVSLYIYEARSFENEHNSLNRGSLLQKIDLPHELVIGSIAIAWSPDSKYIAVLMHHHCRFSQIIMVDRFEGKDVCQLKMPFLNYAFELGWDDTGRIIALFDDMKDPGIFKFGDDIRTRTQNKFIYFNPEENTLTSLSYEYEVDGFLSPEITCIPAISLKERKFYYKTNWSAFNVDCRDFLDGRPVFVVEQNGEEALESIEHENIGACFSSENGDRPYRAEELEIRAWPASPLRIAEQLHRRECGLQRKIGFKNQTKISHNKKRKHDDDEDSCCHEEEPPCKKLKV